MEIRLKTGTNIPDISILNTYAPRMGYNFDEINAYWTDIDNYISTIPHNLVKIGCTDNNGQIANKVGRPDNNLIGNHIIAKMRKM